MPTVYWKSASTAKAFKKLALTPEQRGVADDLIASLATNPFPEGCKKTQGKWNDHYRIDFCADFRLIYRVQSDVVTIVAIGDRKEIYR